MNRLTRRADRRPVRVTHRPFRPEVRLLEERSLPGDTILGALVSHGFVGVAPAITNAPPPAGHATLLDASDAILASRHPAYVLLPGVASVLPPGSVLGAPPDAVPSRQITLTSAAPEPPAHPSGGSLNAFGVEDALAGPLDGPSADALDGLNGAGSAPGLRSLGFTTAEKTASPDSAESSSAAPEHGRPESPGAVSGRPGDANDTADRQLRDALLTQQGADALGVAHPKGDGSGSGQGSTGPRGKGGKGDIPNSLQRELGMSPFPPFPFRNVPFP